MVTIKLIMPTISRASVNYWLNIWNFIINRMVNGLSG